MLLVELWPNGERTDGTYPGWDEFGRVIAHRWVDHTFGPGATSSVPDRTSIVELTYTYDQAGNVLTRSDGRPNSYWNHRHEEFEYDDPSVYRNHERVSPL